MGTVSNTRKLSNSDPLPLAVRRELVRWELAETYHCPHIWAAVLGHLPGLRIREKIYLSDLRDRLDEILPIGPERTQVLSLLGGANYCSHGRCMRLLCPGCRKTLRRQDQMLTAYCPDHFVEVPE